MNIVSALAKIEGLRLSYGDKWLFWDDMWVVCQRKYGAKKTIILCKSEIQDDAINILCEEAL